MSSGNAVQTRRARLSPVRGADRRQRRSTRSLRPLISRTCRVTPPTGACTATYSVQSQWNTGFTGQVRIACSGAALASWKVNWTYGAGQRITQAWNAACTQTGTAVSCANASYNGTVPDGGSVTFGFNASWSGSNPVPTVTLG